MTTKEFKKIARLLKDAYAEVKKEAEAQGTNILDPEFDKVIALVREKILESQGYTLQEYREAKAKVAGFSQADLVDSTERTSTAIEELNQRHIPTLEEIEQIAERVAQKYIVPPQVTNQIVERIEKPTIVKETRIEQFNTTEKVEYNDKPLQEKLGELSKKVDEYKKLKDEKLNGIKEDLKGHFDKTFEKNINTLGMPNFRKLGMGLQGQIDELRASSSNYTLPTASAATKGGVKIGARLTMTGDTLSADVQAGGSGDISNGGNTTGAAIVIGTNDNYGVQIETGGIPRITVNHGASGGVVIAGQSSGGGENLFSVSDGATDQLTLDDFGNLGVDGDVTATGDVTGANLSGTNTGDQVGDGVTITGAGTVGDPFVAVGGGLTLLTATGTVDDSNVDFTFVSEPTLLVINGGVYQKTGGAITWTWLVATATLSVPVGDGGSIFGIA